MSKSLWLDASGAAMWALVNRYTGRVGYERGIKAAGLDADPPVIDCSGWVGLRCSSLPEWRQPIALLPQNGSTEIT